MSVGPILYKLNLSTLSLIISLLSPIKFIFDVSVKLINCPILVSSLSLSVWFQQAIFSKTANKK